MLWIQSFLQNLQKVPNWNGCVSLGFGALPSTLNKFLDPSPPSMRKVDDGEIREKRNEKEKIVVFSGHYVSSLPPERRPLERCMLVPIKRCTNARLHQNYF